MSQLSIRLRFDARLKDFAAGNAHPAYAADLQIGEQIYEPEPGRPYYTGRVSAYARAPLGVGPDTPHQESGIYQVSIHRSQAEADMALLAAAAVAEYFKRGTLLPSIADAPPQPPVHIESASEMPGVPSSGWIAVPVLIRWFTSA